MIFDHSRSLSQHNALGVRLYFASHGLNLYSVLASVSSMFLVSSWWVSPLVKLLQTCYFFFVYLLIETNFCCSSICRIRFHLPHSFTTSQGFFLHHQLTDTNQQDSHRCAQIRSYGEREETRVWIWTQSYSEARAGFLWAEFAAMKSQLNTSV